MLEEVLKELRRKSLADIMDEQLHRSPVPPLQPLPTRYRYSFDSEDTHGCDERREAARELQG